MTKDKIIHDTIVVIHKDTIVKTLEVVDKTQKNVPAVADFFNTYNNFFTALAAIAALIALFISIMAINKTAKDNRHQIRVGKLEEICDIMNLLGVNYPKLFSAYDILFKEFEKSEVSRILNRKKFEPILNEAISEIEFDLLLSKIDRLVVLANLYLGEKPKNFYSKTNSRDDKQLKFSTLIFAEICKNIVMILKYKNLKHNSFSDKLPNPNVTSVLVRNISAHISEIIDYGINTLGYETWRNDFFMDLLKLQDDLNKSK